MRTLVKIKFGSHLYGTNTPSSDLDFKSVVVPDAKDILLGRVPKTSWNSSTKKDSSLKNTAEDIDNEVFTLAGFMKLLSEGQTVALEVLFAPDSHIIEMDPEWQVVRDNAQRLVHKDVTAFFGYARMQAAKYGLKGSRLSVIKRFLYYLEDIPEETTLSELLSLTNATKNLKIFVDMCSDLKLDEKEPLIRWTDKTYKRNGVECTETYLEICNRKLPLHDTVKQAKQIFNKVYDEYGKRARQAESNENLDWKALSHAVRVGKQAVELLDTGKITLPRPEASALLSIKKGEVDYKTVSSLIEALLTTIKVAQEESKLPDKFDSKLGEDLVLHFYEMAVIESDGLADMRNIFP